MSKEKYIAHCKRWWIIFKSVSFKPKVKFEIQEVLHKLGFKESPEYSKTTSYCVGFIKGELWCIIFHTSILWRINNTKVSFEEIFDKFSEEEKNTLIYNLDLFI